MLSKASGAKPLEGKYTAPPPERESASAKVRPRGIGISGTFTSMNYLTLYRDLGAVERQENWLVGLHGLKSATECIECGLCEGACP